jgi:hypothetical protein
MFLHPVSLSNKIFEGSSFQTITKKQKQKQKAKKAVNHFERARFFFLKQPNETIKGNLQHFNILRSGKNKYFS